MHFFIQHKPPDLKHADSPHLRWNEFCKRLMYSIIVCAGYASIQDDMQHPSHTVHVSRVIIAQS